jgi:hypothetical protein
MTHLSSVFGSKCPGADLGWHRPNEGTDLVAIPELAKYPSWIWLSHRGEVRAGRIGSHKNLRLVLKKWRIMWKTTPLTSLLSFELSDVISLRTLKSVETGSLVAYQQREILMRRSGDPLAIWLCPDEKAKAIDFDNLWLLLLNSSKNSIARLDIEIRERCLMIVPVGGGERIITYRRIGYAEIWGHAGDLKLLSNFLREGIFLV